METLLDCRGLLCPMPIVQISRTIKGLAAGDVLVVMANDPAFFADVTAWVQKLGHELLSHEAGPEGQLVRVRKS